MLRGLINSAPRLAGGDATKWSFGLNHLVNVLDQELGANLDQGVHVRGSYYAYNAPLVILLTERTAADVDSPAAHQAVVVHVGFSEDQGGFSRR